MMDFFSFVFFDLYSLWHFINAFSPLATSAATVIALVLAYQTGIFNKTPNVVASGAFVIAKSNGANKKRDQEIDHDKFFHTFQLINVGRGLAVNITPSANTSVHGDFLEDICPSSYVLASGKSTRDLGETLRVSGQVFVPEKKILSFHENNNRASFIIDYQDYEGKEYQTKVTIAKVQIADGQLDSLRRTPGIEIWKIIHNSEIKG